MLLLQICVERINSSALLKGFSFFLPRAWATALRVTSFGIGVVDGAMRSVIGLTFFMVMPQPVANGAALLQDHAPSAGSTRTQARHQGGVRDAVLYQL